MLNQNVASMPSRQSSILVKSPPSRQSSMLLPSSPLRQQSIFITPPPSRQSPMLVGRILSSQQQQPIPISMNTRNIIVSSPPTANLYKSVSNPSPSARMMLLKSSNERVQSMKYNYDVSNNTASARTADGQVSPTPSLYKQNSDSLYLIVEQENAVNGEE